MQIAWGLEYRASHTGRKTKILSKWVEHQKEVGDQLIQNYSNEICAFNQIIHIVTKREI
tara:strand:- start:105 stop:281 length:177 start_codon:yes stop_codon:yes gene_type:complete